MKSFRFELPMWMPHLPGQHYDVRLTAPDGYHAQRSYSIASSPLDEGEIELTIDRLDDGEVSPYFHDVVVEVGDQVEVRGPVRLLLRLARRGAGAAGRRRLGRRAADVRCSATAAARCPSSPMRLVYSVRARRRRDLRRRARRRRRRSPTRARRPTGWTGHTGPHRRGACCAARPTARGSRSSAARTASSRRRRELLLEAGMAPGAIRTERYGDAGSDPVGGARSRPRCRAPRPRRR